MPTLHAAAALPALADVDRELAYDGLAGNLGLELLGRAGFHEGSLAVGAGLGQRGVVAFADVVGIGQRPMAVVAVVRAGFPSRRSGFRLWRSLAKGCGLALAGAERVFEAAGQLGQLGFELRYADAEGLAARARGVVHPAMLRTERSISCAKILPA